MLTTLPIAHIKPNDYNPNIIDSVKFDALKNLIEKFGFLQPILVEPANEEGAHIIIDGEHRWRALKELGETGIPCVIFESEESREEYRKLLTVAMNSVRGTNDEEKLKTVFEEIAEFMTLEEITGATGILESDVRLLLNYSDIPDIEVPSIEKEDGVDKLKSSQFSFGRVKIVVSDKEAQAFQAAYEKYVEINGSDAGFIGSLIDDVNASEESEIESAKE